MKTEKKQPERRETIPVTMHPRKLVAKWHIDSEYFPTLTDEVMEEIRNDYIKTVKEDNYDRAMRVVGDGHS